MISTVTTMFKWQLSFPWLYSKSKHQTCIFLHPAQVTHGCGSVLIWRQCNTLYTSSFVDYVTFSHNSAYAAYGKAYNPGSQPAWGNTEAEL